jgi:hypothetical protein
VRQDAVRHASAALHPIAEAVVLAPPVLMTTTTARRG